MKQLQAAQKKDEALRGGLPSGGGEGLNHVAAGSSKQPSHHSPLLNDSDALRTQAISAYRAKKKGGSGGATMQSLKALVYKSAVA